MNRTNLKMFRAFFCGAIATVLLLGQTLAVEEVPAGKTAVAEAVAVLMPIKNSGVEGTISLTQEIDHVAIKGTVRGLKPGLHGFHIHDFGDLRASDGASVGGHYNPSKKEHGALDSKVRHEGDLGNLEALLAGVAAVDVKLPGVKLGQLLGRSLVVHQDPDDLKTQPAGNAGPRIAVGVIGIASPEASRAPGPGTKLDVNTASLQQIQNLPGVGAAMGVHIWVGRPFRSLDDLARDGVPLNTIEQIRDLITFGP